MSSCEIHDAGLFIGLTSTPVGGESRFFQQTVEPVFRKYRDAVKANFKESDQEEETGLGWEDTYGRLYQPRAFFMFGRFDLAVLSLVDDFEFGIRTFGPMDPMLLGNGENGNEGSEPQQHREVSNTDFDHQTICGPIPRFDEDQNVYDLTNPLLNRENRAKPLIAICQIKVNSGILIGAGLDFLHLVIRGLQQRLEKFNKAWLEGIGEKEVELRKLSMLIAESYSWHELSLVISGSSYTDIANFIIQFREMTVQDLINLIDEPGAEEIFQKCLCAEIIRKRPAFEMKDSHVFETSATTFGFNFELYSDIEVVEEGKQDAVVERIWEQDRIAPVCKWFTKAGHVGEVLKRLGVATSDETYYGCIGKGDFVYPRPDEINTRDFLKMFVRGRRVFGDRKHVLNTYTTVFTSLDLEDREVCDKHLYFQESVASNLVVSADAIKELNRWLVRGGVPKTISERIQNILPNFNKGIGDTSLFGFFVELQPLMHWLNVKVRDWSSEEDGPSKLSLETFTRFLSKVANAFDLAFKNRFYSGYRMNEITDFNLEFKGGVQQLVSAFDTAFKAIIGGATDHGSHNHVFAVVGGDPWVATNEFSLSLNYVHLFQPEFFASFVGHETGNYEFQHERKVVFSPPRPHEIDQFFASVRGEFSKDVGDVFEYLVSAELFDHVAADMVAYHMSFFGESDLFQFWHWAHLYSLPRGHRSGERLEDVAFIAMLLRTLSVIRLCEPDAFESITPYKTKNEKVDELLEKWDEVAKKFVNAIWEYEPFGLWADRTRKHAAKTMFAGSSDSCSGYDAAMYKQAVKELAGDYAVDFSNGKSVHYSTKSERERKSVLENPSTHARTLLFAYMSRIREICRDHNFLLRRNPKKEGRHDIMPGDAPLMFDPRGGTFTCGPSTRRVYFRSRAALVFSLLDMAAVLKKDMILTRLSDKAHSAS